MPPVLHVQRCFAELSAPWICTSRLLPNWPVKGCPIIRLDINRYDFKAVYDLPVWLRKYIYKEITDFYSEEKKAYENAKSGKKGGNTKTLVSSDGKINTPEFLKASKEYKGKTSYK